MADKKPAKPNKGKAPDNRTKAGTFKKGESGNPGGRPKIPEDIKQAFKDLTPAAIATLTEIVNCKSAKHSDRIKAAEIILDRGWGKPTQSMEIETNKVPQVVFINGDDVLD